MADTEKTPATIESNSAQIENINAVLGDVIDKLAEMTKAITETKAVATTAAAAGKKTTGLFGGKRKQTPMKDLLTGDIYISKAAVGKKFATEVGKEPTDTFAWYTVMNKLKMPKSDKAGAPAENSDRFVAASDAEAAAVKAKVAAQAEVERAETQKRLDAEEAAKNKAAAPVATPAVSAQKPGQQQNKSGQGHK